MTEPIVVAAVGLMLLTLILATAIVLERAWGDRRRAGEAAMRPQAELQLADYLAGEEVGRPKTELERRMLLQAGLEALGEVRGTERERLTELLERTGIVAEVFAHLDRRSARVRRRAAEMLARIGSPQSIDRLRMGLEDRDPSVRLACAAALAELGDRESAGRILAAVDEAAAASPGAVAPIVLTLGREMPEALGAALERGRPPELRRIAAATVGELRLAQHMAFLREALDDPDDEIVSRAAKGLGEIGDSSAVPELLRLLAEGRPRFVELAVIGALGKIGDPVAAAPLELELRYGNWQLRQLAAQVLRRLGPQGRAVLERTLSTRDEELRAQVEMVLQ